MTTPYNTTTQGLGTAPAIVSNKSLLELSDEHIIEINNDEINREATRYLVFVGDLISAPQKRERTDLVMGGEYFGTHFKTLVKSRGLLRRCQITPMEKAYDHISPAMMGDNPTNLTVSGVTGTPQNPLNSIPVMPGDEIRGIVAMDRNHQFGSKGIIEVESLRGIDARDFQRSGLQQEIIPNWDNIMLGVEALPITLRELRTNLNARRDEVSIDAKSIIDVYLDSCERWMLWGKDYLKFSSALVRTPMSDGFAHVYSPLAEQLFIQLEIKREDLLATVFDAPAGKSDNTELMAQMVAVMTKLAENQQPTPSAPADATSAIETAILNTVKPNVTPCNAVKANGDPCKGSAMANGRCVFHNKV